jgi:uncharacterized protein (DUF58 family)
MDNYIKRPLVRFHKAAIFYALLLVFSLIFTQALRATASSVLFWFLVLVPLLSLIYVLVGKALVRIYVSSTSTKVDKLTPLEYELRIVNASPFAYPFIEAVVSIPENDGVRCTEQSVNMSLAPLAAYSVKREASFKYRGTYDIGVRCLYISDFLGLFSIRLDAYIYEKIMVFPRKLDMEIKMQTSASDIPNDSAKVVFSTEKSEIGNIREYIPGDSQKNIHWKLSSKSSNGTLMVKEFNTNTSRSVYMLCDFSRSIPGEVFEDEDVRIAREKAAAEAARKPKEKHVKLKKAKQDKKALEAERAAKKAQAMAKRGASANRIGDAALVDELINTAAESKKPTKVKDKSEKKSFFASKKKKNDIEEIQLTDEQAAANEKKRRDDEIRNELSIGGTIIPEFVNDIDEYCADGVVEMSIGAVLNELRNGNNVTLIWVDKRQTGGIAAVELTCPEDFDVIYPVFATTAPCSEKDNVTTLLPLVTESLNVTIRICTSNIDPLSLNRYSAIPGLFGGAGTGCVAEVLLFNPEERYTDVKIRREYIGMCKNRLAQDGVDLTELETVKDENGRYNLRKAAH